MARSLKFLECLPPEIQEKVLQELSIESVDKVLREVHKPSGKKHYLALEHKLKKYPQIFTKGFLMVGFPNETLAQIKETIDMAIQINLDWYTIQVAHPLPKTEMHTQMVQMGEIIEDAVDAEKLNYGNRTG